MGWLYAQTWLWYLLAFVVGVLLARLLFGRAPAAGGARPPRADGDRREPVPAAAVPEARADDGPGRRDDAVTEQFPAVDPALSTLDVARGGGPGTAARAAGALGAAGVTGARAGDGPDAAVTTEIPVVPPADSTERDGAGEETTQIPVVAPEPEHETETETGTGAPAVVPGRFPGSALPLEDGSPPTPEHTIKGNGQSMLYHTPKSPYYSRTRAEVWFTSTADAEAAGFTDIRSRRR